MVIALEPLEQAIERGPPDEQRDRDEAEREGPSVRPTDAASTAPPRIRPEQEREAEASPRDRPDIIAAAMTSRPMSVLKRPRSSSVFAMTGSAEIDSATPRNSAKSRRWSTRTRSESGSEKPSATPPAMGSAIPRTDVMSALLAAAPDDAEIDLEPRDDEQEDDADRRVAAEHLLRRRQAEEEGLRRRGETPEERRSEGDAGGELARDERQPDSPRSLAEQARRREQRREREQEREDVVLAHRRQSNRRVARTRPSMHVGG